jgi:HAD superfamily hydrolase (TIGR01450 family)
MPWRSSQVTAVAFVGLGAMGSRMAHRLLDADQDLVVWNRTRAKAESLLESGATLAETPADAARQAEIIVTMVTGPPALRAVVESPDGIAAGLRGTPTLIEMSTVGPAAVARLASVLPPGTGLLDAPVLGSLTEAESGSLTIFVGGPIPLVERVTPLLEALGSPTHVGTLGAGAAAKLVANATLFGALGTLGEALALAQGLGLSREAAYQVLAATPLAAQAERRRGAIEAGEYPPRFPLALARKDASLISEAAVAAHVDLRLTRAAEEWLAEAEEADFGGRDYTAVLATILHSGDGDRSRLWTVAPSTPSSSGMAPVDYDGFIIDLDGVVWRGHDPIDGAAEAIAALRANGTRVMFLTNEPGSSRSAFAARLADMGIPAAAADVMTSAAATARVVGELEGFKRRQAFVVGPPALHDEIRGAGFHVVSPEEARQAEVVVVGGHQGFDYAELRAATAAIRNGARLFATGRDAVFPTPEGPWPGTGAILAAVETAGGVPAVVVGKPEPIMFEIAREVLSGCERVAVIGDHLIADIAGAKRAGLGAILVLTGTTSRADLERAGIQPDLVLESLAALPEEMRTRS